MPTKNAAYFTALFEVLNLNFIAQLSLWLSRPTDATPVTEIVSLESYQQKVSMWGRRLYWLHCHLYSRGIGKFCYETRKGLPFDESLWLVNDMKPTAYFINLPKALGF